MVILVYLKEPENRAYRNDLQRQKTKGGTQHTEKVSELMGLSAAQMVGEETVSTQVQEEAQKLVNERLEHEIDRLLNGYGG